MQQPAQRSTVDDEQEEVYWRRLGRVKALDRTRPPTRGRLMVGLEGATLVLSSSKLQSMVGKASSLSERRLLNSPATSKEVGSLLRLARFRLTGSSSDED